MIFALWIHYWIPIIAFGVCVFAVEQRPRLLFPVCLIIGVGTTCYWNDGVQNLQTNQVDALIFSLAAAGWLGMTASGYLSERSRRKRLQGLTNPEDTKH